MRERSGDNCSSPNQRAAPAPWAQQQAASGAARFISTAFTPGSDWNDQPAIIGLWKFEFLAKGNTGPTASPDGAPIDAGYVTWHSDGTELMNSGRPPMTGSFCVGVWKQVGKSTFKLNHYALSWDPSGTVFVGPANITETVTVNRSGNDYSGIFHLVQYATDEKTVYADIKGTITATRVTVN